MQHANLRKVSLNSVFYDNGISFPFGMLQGRNFRQKLCFFTKKHIEIRKSFMAYRPPPLVPIKAFACICIHIFCTIYESGVLAQGGGGEGGGKDNLWPENQ